MRALVITAAALGVVGYAAGMILGYWGQDAARWVDSKLEQLAGQRPDMR